MSKDTGGPAFPVVEVVEYGSGPRETQHAGMTLRDYFAAHSPVSMDEAAKSFESAFGTQPTYEQCIKLLVGMQYTYADAMLAERVKS